MTVDYAASGLLQASFFEILDPNRRALDELRGVTSATRERNIYATPRSGASIEMTLQQPLSFERIRVRWWAAAKSPEGDSGLVPLFTGIPVSPGERRSQAGTSVSLSLLDFSTILDTPLGKHHAVSPGDLVTGRLRSILTAAGADAVITESSATVSAGMFWLATETKRRMVNDLLEAIGYSAVWADAWGRLRCEPYVAPGARPVESDLGFIHGETCTYKPTFTVEHDTSTVPNHAVVTARMMGGLEPVVGEAWLPAVHPYSVQNREGREVPYVEADVDLAVAPLPDGASTADTNAYLGRVKAAADAYAARRLQERSTPARSYLVENRWRPFELQQATRFYSPARGASPEIRRTVTIGKDTTKYVAGGPLTMSTTLLEVPA